MENGYECHVWTVDDLKTAKRFKKWGAKSIFTNVPDYMKKNLVESGKGEFLSPPPHNTTACGSAPGVSQSLSGRSRIVNIHPKFLNGDYPLFLQPLIRHAGLCC